MLCVLWPQVPLQTLLGLNWDNPCHALHWGPTGRVHGAWHPSDGGIGKLVASHRGAALLCVPLSHLGRNSKPAKKKPPSGCL